jgi:hypothetical protein
VYTRGGTTTVRNSTISANIVRNGEVPDTEGGGIYIQGGTVTLRSATLAGNQADTGSAIHREGPATVSLSHTIVSGTGLLGACTGGPFTGDHNLVADASCASQVGNAQLGPLTNNGGPTNTHALPAGSPAVNAGTSCDATDQRGLPRHGACDIGAYEFQGAGAVQPGVGQLPPPKPGKSVNALTKSGTVKIKLPGAKTFVVLGKGQQIPVNTIVDTRKGRVTLIAAAYQSGGTATAVFYDGLVKLTQSKGAKPITTLTLIEKLTGCKASGKASAAKKKPKKRRLWGDGKGRFRTKGQYSSATVRGTKWLVEDRCTTTLTRVKRGKVAVRDFVKRKTVLVKAGKKYLARAR